MSGKFKIILIDNLIVRNMDLQVGENIIGNDIYVKKKKKSEFNQAAIIYLSPDCEISIRPCKEVLCYIRNYGTSCWKLVKPNWTLILNVKDICMLFPNKIWFKVISTMDTTDESNNPKRKLEEIIEDELPDKRHCSLVSVETEASNNLSYNNNESNLIGTDCENNIDCDIIDSNSIHCHNFETEDEFQSCSAEQNNEKAINDNKEDTCKEKESDNLNFSDCNIANPESSQQYIDLDKTQINNNTDNLNLISTSNNQNILKQKCKYGSKCYRLNDEHKKKYSHPGDIDYEITDNRPECVYGRKCYRKNPQHKIEYKHTIIKRKKALTHLTVVAPEDLTDWEDSDSEEESIDESEYEPSFIDDESLEEYESDFGEDD